VKRVILRKLNDVTVRGQHQVKISNRFLALENLDDDVNGGVLESIQELQSRKWVETA
jgi:hypothetical protein